MIHGVKRKTTNYYYKLCARARPITAYCLPEKTVVEFYVCVECDAWLHGIRKLVEACQRQLSFHIISCINFDFPHTHTRAHTNESTHIESSTSNLSLLFIMAAQRSHRNGVRSYEHNIQINCVSFILTFTCCRIYSMCVPLT